MIHSERILVAIAAFMVVIGLLTNPLLADTDSKPTEALGTTYYCASIGGQEETRHNYQTPAGKRGYIRVDCETSVYVIEAGLDKRSSLDSIQQALFMSAMTGKIPHVVIYDTDGVEGIYEYRIRTSSELAGIKYSNPKYIEG